MKLNLLFASISAIFYIASANDVEHGGFSLVKRDHGLPYQTLPSATCATPAACSNIATPVNCRCSDILTTCQNNAGQFCWGSKSLNSTSCPTMSGSCSSSSFGSRTPSCLCNSQNILCVDNANNYCYGSISGNTVSDIPIPNAAPSAAASSSSAVIPSSGTNPTMSVVGAPSNSAPSATPTSGAAQINNKYLLSMGCAIAAYIAIH